MLRRYRAQQHSLGDPGGPVAADVAGHFAAAGEVVDEDRVMQVERLEECTEVVGVGVEVVAVPRLARTAASASIVRDGAVAVGCFRLAGVRP
jgi:hypothetical protein